LLNCNEDRFRLFIRLSIWRFVDKLHIKNMKKRKYNLFSLRCSHFPGTIVYGRFHDLCTIFLFGLRVTQALGHKTESYLF